MALFLFDMFVSIKSYYSQMARLTVTNASLDRIEEVFAAEELKDEGRKELGSISDAGSAPAESRSSSYADDGTKIRPLSPFSTEQITTGSFASARLPVFSFQLIYYFSSEGLSASAAFVLTVTVSSGFICARTSGDGMYGPTCAGLRSPQPQVPT